MDLKTIHSALEQLAEEKGIAREKIMETIEMALAAAYKKEYGKRGQMVKELFNPETGEISFSQIKIVVDETMIKTEEEIVYYKSLTNKISFTDAALLLLSQKLGAELVTFDKQLARVAKGAKSP